MKKNSNVKASGLKLKGSLLKKKHKDRLNEIANMAVNFSKIGLKSKDGDRSYTWKMARDIKDYKPHRSDKKR